MAGNSDGSIIIDTELDNSGFDKGSQKLLDAVRDLTKAVNTLGDNMARSFQSVISELQNIGDAAEKASAGYHALRSETVGLDKESQSFAAVMDKLSASVRNGFSTGSAVIKFKDQIDEAASKAQEFEQHLKAFGNAEIPTDDYKWLTVEIEKARKSLNQLIERQDRMRDLGVEESSKQWQNIAYSIAQAKAQISDYEAEMASMRMDGTAFTMGSDTAEYQQMNSQLEQARAVLEQNKALIDAETIAQAQLNIQVAQEAVIAAKTAAERQGAMERLRAAQANLNSLASQSSAKATTPSPVAPSPAAMTGWQKFKNIMSAVGKTALRTGATIARVSLKTLAIGAKVSYIAIKALGKGLKFLVGFLGKAISRMASFNKQSRGMGRNANGLASIFSNFKMMLGFSLISKAISAVTKEISESIGMLARFSDEFDSTLSNITNSVKALAGNITVTLSNALIAIEPMLTQIVDAVSQAFTYMNALFAKMQGKTTMTVAKKQTDSYAASLEDAAESAEELKNQVYGFDELNKRSGQNTSSTGKEKQPEDLFEEVAVDSIIPEELLNIFDKIKAAIENSDWNGLGKIAAEGLNNLLQTIDDWITNVFRPKGVEWTQNIAELLNGLADGSDWTLLGKTISDGLNSVAGIINTFLTTFSFENFGNGFGEAINGFFGNIEWDLVGQTFANGFNALIDLIFGLINTVDWISFGASVANSFNSMFNTVDWTAIAEGINAAISGLFDTVNGFLEQMDWSQLGSHLGNFINTLDIKSWLADLGTFLSNLITSAIDLAIGFVETIDWGGLIDALWNGIGDMLQNVDWTGIINGAFELLGAAISAAVSAVVTLALDIWNLLKQAWESVKTYFSEYIDSFGGDIVAGLWEGIKNALLNAGQWIVDNIFTPFIEGFKKAFGIHSPSTEMEAMGSYVIEGLWQGIQNAWGSITEFFSNAVESIKSTLSDAWDKISTTAGTAWNTVKTTVSNKFNELKSTLQTTGNNIKSTLSNAWSNIQSTATQKWTSIKSTVTNLWNGLKSTLSSTDWGSVGSNLVSGLQSGISRAWSGLKSAVSKLATGLTNMVKGLFGISSPSTVWAKIGEYLDEGLVEGIKGGTKSILTTTSNLAKAVNSSMELESPEIDVAASATMNGIDALTAKFDNFIDSLKSIATILNSAGTLTVPSVAAGTVVPYKVKANTLGDSSALTGLSESLQSGMTDQTEIMSEVMYLLGQILEVIRRLNLKIDADSLVDAITYLQRNNERNFGGV